MTLAVHDEDLRGLVRVLGTLGSDARCNLSVDDRALGVLVVEATDNEVRLVHREALAHKAQPGIASVNVRDLVQAIGGGVEACSLSVKGTRLLAQGTIDAWKPLLEAGSVDLMLPVDEKGVEMAGVAGDWLPALTWCARLPAKLKAANSIGECAWWHEKAIFAATGMVMHSVGVTLRNEGPPLALPWRLGKLPIAADAPVILAWRPGHLQVRTNATTWWLPLTVEVPPDVAGYVAALTFGTEVAVDAAALLDLVRQIESLVTNPSGVPLELSARGGRLRASVPENYEGGGSGDIAAEITGPEDTTKWFGFHHVVPALRPYAEGKGKVTLRYIENGQGAMLRDENHTTLIAGRLP